MGYCVHPFAIRFHSLIEADTENLDGYALMELVERLGGRFMSNMQWSAMRMSWFDMVDDALAKAGSDVKLSNHFYASPPIKFVLPDDFPMIGHIKPEEAPKLAKALKAVHLEGQEADAVQEVLGWLAELRAGEGIVTFYH